jgi:hypothetical protein
VHHVDPDRFLETVRSMPLLDAEAVFSTHLPPATGMSAQFEAMLAQAPDTNPFVGPDQQALQAMLASFEPVAAAT